MSDRSRDWMAQAQDDLEAALVLRDGGKHGQACFTAQQAAEKAVKAVHLSRLVPPWGHSIIELLEALHDVPESLMENARVLDGYYIPTRYPNGHASGASFRYYGPRQSQQAIEYAREIVEYALTQMAGAR
ncbi:MAG TPA: HEPN domain-containing protein [Thermoanaerobaculia bacterium]|nr:HEPN domain-containing protein [Thermoanaerobaculia bacterium]